MKRARASGCQSHIICPPFAARELSAEFSTRSKGVEMRRAPEGELERMRTLCRERYRGFNVKHSHEQLEAHHGYKLRYTATRLALQAAGLVEKAPGRGKHRKKRQRRPLPGILLSQDGSPHRWIPGLDRELDLIVTLDDATSELYSAFPIDQDGTVSSFIALHETITVHGLFGALYTDRGSHYFYTPKAGAKVDTQRLTQIGRAPKQLDITP